MKYFDLNNGERMPMVGIGTFLFSPAEAENSVYEALMAGYPLIDTANAYMNERGVGRGIKRSGGKRELKLPSGERKIAVGRIICGFV